ncbi:hypothetical protein ACJZ2D_013243 [Fusarium nematophilum]
MEAFQIIIIVLPSFGTTYVKFNGEQGWSFELLDRRVASRAGELDTNHRSGQQAKRKIDLIPPVTPNVAKDILESKRISSKARGYPRKQEDILESKRISSKARGYPRKQEDILESKRISSKARGYPRKQEDILESKRISSKARGYP